MLGNGAPRYTNFLNVIKDHLDSTFGNGAILLWILLKRLDIASIFKNFWSKSAVFCNFSQRRCKKNGAIKLSTLFKPLKMSGNGARTCICQKSHEKSFGCLNSKWRHFFLTIACFLAKKQQKSCIDLWKMAPFTKLDVIEYCTSFSTSFSRSKAHKNTILMLITWSQKKRQHFYIFDDFLGFCSNFLLKFIITLLKKWRHFSFWRL